MRKSSGSGIGGRGGPSNLPIPTYSRGSPASSTTSSLAGRGRSIAHSSEDIPRQFGSSLSPAPNARRAPSPGDPKRRSLLSPARAPGQQANAGVRYITDDMIRKMAKEDNLDQISSLNLTFAKEGGKKIKYVENLDKLRKLQTLNLSYNVIERMEKMEKLLRLRDLNLSNNLITRIEGLENLTSLQSLNLNCNQIEHIPQWVAKKLKALRTFRIAQNRLSSLNEVSKLKPLPDLIQLDVANNPLCDLPHCRFYIVFHLRTMELLDGQAVNDRERKQAQDRFALDEVEQLEKRLEQKENKVKQLEESQNRSDLERNQQETSQSQLLNKEKHLTEQLKKMEQEAVAKDDLLKKKTQDLNKASQKHYQLEQELAFYKIDSKFDSLNEAPRFHVENASDDSGELQEAPYIGKARFRANQFAQESSIVAAAAPQRGVLSARASPGIVRRSLSPPSKDPMHKQLDAQLEHKHAEVKHTEEKLKSLQDDLSSTEKRLMNATTELKKLSMDRNTPEHFRDDNKYKIRQRLARKMQRVNALRDQATQMEQDIDRKHEVISGDRNNVHQMQHRVASMNPNDPTFERLQRELEDKERKLNESSQRQIELQKELEEALSQITKETADIKKLEEQLSADQIEQNEELRHELDDIVSGLSGYLENVKGQSIQHKQEFEMLLQEKEALEEKIRRMEAELNILEGEASSARFMRERLSELEDSLRRTEDMNTTLNNEVQRSRERDPELQARLSSAESEARQLRQTLNETERTADSQRKNLENQLTSERDRAERMTQKIQDVNRQELETKKLVSQLEAAKAMNAGLRDQVEEFRHKQQMEEGGFKPSDLKKRLKKFTHEFKTNKHPIEPQGKNDILGTTFQDLQKHVIDQMNNSNKEVDDLKKKKEKSEKEIQTLKDKMKKLENSSKKDSKVDEDNRRLQEEIRKLKKSLSDAKDRNKEGAIPVRIVYRPDSDNSFDRASSLNTDEKFLFDELQRELIDLKRSMRQKDDDLSKKLTEAETEAAHWKEEMKNKEKEFDAEIEQQRQATDLLKEKQEARIQVIAQDLDQAQFVADSLQQMLEDRERHLNEEVGNADMSNQMISAQEDELARLYDILETQKDEIENLNQILDHLAQQGPDGVGAAFDDELWRIRQDVNNLKETLAMQSAYVQAMPSIGHGNTQTNGLFAGGSGAHTTSMGVGTGGVGVGGGAGGVGAPIRGAGEAAGTQVGGGRGAPGVSGYGSAATLPSSHQAGHAPPRAGAVSSTSAALPPSGPAHTSSGPTHSSNRSGMHMTGMAMASTPMPRSHQSSGLAADPRAYPAEHLGTERRESKAPHGGKPSALGKAGDGLGGPMHPHSSHPKAGKAGYDGGASGAPNNSRLSRGRAAARAHQQHQQQHQQQQQQQQHRPSIPSAFEPVHRPEPYHPYQSAPINPAPIPVAPPLPHPHPSAAAVMPQSMAGAVGQQFVPQANIPPNQGGPARASQTSGVQGPSRGVQASGLPAPIFYPPAQAGGVAPPPMHVAPSGYVAVGPAPMTHAGSGEPAVAFDPVPMEISYNPGSVLDGGAADGMYNVGGQSYLPAGPAQLLHYGPGRVFMPAGRGLQHQQQQQQQQARGPARIYYPPHHPIPMPAPGGAPPPPPPGGFGQLATPLIPVASGTPIKGGNFPPTGYYDSSYSTLPPSPIRPIGMDSSPPRGILKNAPPMDASGGDSYLFCNVPEHHDLEDYISELQDKIKKLKLRTTKEKEFHEASLQHEDKKTVKRLLVELEDRRDELEALDLAIERQKRNLWERKYDERELKQDSRDARAELESLKRKNEKRLFKKLRRQTDEDSFDEFMEINRQRYLKGEVECLEKTLAKRQAQLRDAERDLKECNHKIREAKEESRDMVDKYDSASSKLQQARQEYDVIERRANEVGVELVKASEQLVVLKADVKDADKKKVKQEKLLREINNVIAKKDAQFKDLDSKLKYATQSLQSVQQDLAVHSQREKDMVDTLRDSEDLLSKRRAEIQKMRDQVDQNRLELEQLDQQMGRKRTELSLLEETHSRKEQEFNNVLHDAEMEISSKHQAIKDCRDELDQLEGQKVDLNAHLKTKRNELFKLKEETQQEEEVLQRLSNSVNKNKSELKHTFEMQKLEQTELESVKAQHAQKLVELERTQRAFLEEKAEYEQLSAETSRKSADLDRLRQAVERERSEVDRLTSEKQELDDRILTLSRDRDLLSENCKGLDDKLNTMKRNQRILEEKSDSTTARLEVLEAEVRLRERQMEETEIQRESMEKDLTSLKHAITDSKSELKTLNETIREAEEQMRGVEQDVRNSCHQRDEVKQEVERLTEQIRQSEASYEDSARQEKVKYKELQDLMRSLTEREREQQEARISLNKIRKEIEKEENRLNRLVSKANGDLEMVRQELTDKQDELEGMRKEYTQLQGETDAMQLNKEKLDELAKSIENLEKDVQERNQEKMELAKALTVSYEEVQRLRNESSQMQDSMTKERVQLENTLKDLQSNLDQTKQELQQAEVRTTQQVAEIQSLAEKHFNRANSLEGELCRVKQENIVTKKQLLSQEILMLKLDAMSDGLSLGHDDTLDSLLQTTDVQASSQRNQISRRQHRTDDDAENDIGDTEEEEEEEEEDSDESDNNSDKFFDDKENRSMSPPRPAVSHANNLLKSTSARIEEDRKNNALRERLAEEQDYLRFQLRQQMMRHTETMETARIKSEETIDCLKRKLNTLQEVLFNTNPDIQAIREMTRSRSTSPASRIASPYRNRSQSPLSRSSHSYSALRMSRSTDRLPSPIFPERDYII